MEVMEPVGMDAGGEDESKNWMAYVALRTGYSWPLCWDYPDMRIPNRDWRDRLRLYGTFIRTEDAGDSWLRLVYLCDPNRLC